MTHANAGLVRKRLQQHNLRAALILTRFTSAPSVSSSSEATLRGQTHALWVESLAERLTHDKINSVLQKKKLDAPVHASKSEKLDVTLKAAR